MEHETLLGGYRKAVAEILAKAAPGVNPKFGPADAKELRILHSLELPASIAVFYEEFAPDEKLGVWGIERDCVLLPIGGIEWYSSQRLGKNLKRNRYVVFATTLSGDVYCFDLDAPSGNGDVPVFLISHENDYSQSSRDDIALLRKSVADSLLVFLMDF